MMSAADANIINFFTVSGIFFVFQIIRLISKCWYKCLEDFFFFLSLESVVFFGNHLSLICLWKLVRTKQVLFKP